MSDYKSQQTHIEGMEAFATSVNLPFDDPRRSANGGMRVEGGRWSSKKPKSQKDIPKNPLTIPYLLHAYGVSRSSFKRRVMADRKGVPMEAFDRRKVTKTFVSVIESRTAASNMYTPRYFYVKEAIMCDDKSGYGLLHSDRVMRLGKKFDALVERKGDISRWERQAREHDAQFPFIKQELIDALEAQVCRSFRQLSRVGLIFVGCLYVPLT